MKSHTIKFQPRYRVLCEVWGGVTGYRSGYAKRDDVEIIFDTKDKAETFVLDANDKVLGITTANFRYTVVRDDVQVT